jgi:arsenic resistance protein ArsH
MSHHLSDLPNLQTELFQQPDISQLRPASPSQHPPRFLLLYGSLRERSYSKLLTLEAARLLTAMGAEVKYLIRKIYRCRMAHRKIIRKSENYAN